MHVILLILMMAWLAPPGDSSEAPAAAAVSDGYLGQAPPGETPEVFAPGIISDAGYRLHGAPAFSPDGKRVYWPVIPPALMYAELTDSGWSTPAQADLPGRGIGSPVFSGDGTRLYYQAVLPEGYGSLDLWYVETAGDTVFPAVNLGTPPNSEGLESQPSFTRSGELYFTGTLDGAGMNRGIYVSRHEDDRYLAPQLLNSFINSDGIDYTPFVAPDGSFLLFSSSRPTAEESDLKLYVSFPDSDGNWQEPKNLSAALNWGQPARFPGLSPDGRYLFFLSGGKVYWVLADVIRKLR